MQRDAKPITVLMADDNPRDRDLMKGALEEAKLPCQLQCVENGEELLDYLYRRGKYSNPGAAPRPALILLDLNMPTVDGRDALRALKSNSQLRCIPVVILTSSQDEEDLELAYDLGVNSFITKPLTFEALVKVAQELGRYWLEVVELPNIPLGA